MGYTGVAIKGATWISAFRISTRLLSFVKIAVLARVLSPAQFGVFGIASLVLAFLEILTETGINILLVQSKKGIEEYVNSAWVVSILRGFIIASLIIISSPLISSFFNSPESLGILMLISFVPLIRGFINPAIASFQKELKFKYEFWFRTSVFFVDGLVSVALAVMTMSVYSLAWGLLAGAVFEVLLSFIVVKSRPRFELQKEYFREIFHKGKWVTMYGVFNYISENGDDVMVGKIIGTPALGLYQMAYKISILPISEVSDVVSRVVFPVYTKMAEDKDRLFKAFFKTITSISLVSVLVGLVIFLYSKEIIEFVLGNQWVSASPVLKVLALYGVLRTISGPASALFLSLGKQNYVFLMTSFRLLGLLLSIYPLILLYGLIGAAYAQVISVIIELPVILFFVFRLYKKL